MRVVVTGAGGFIGAHVVRRLLQEDDIEVVGIARRPSKRLPDAQPRFSVVAEDLATTPLLAPPSPWLISLAATAEPSECLRDPINAYANNVRLMVNTLGWAVRSGAHVLHVSTNEVFGPGRVELPHQPSGPYAGAKAAQEMACLASDVPTTIVNTQNLFGHWQQSNKFVPTVVRSLQAHRPVRLQASDGEFASRPFLHADSLAEGLLHLIRTESPTDRVNLASGMNVPLTTVVGHLSSALDTEAQIEPVDAGDRPGHELHGAPLVPNVPGWTPASLEDDLNRTAQWYMEHPEWLIA